MDRLVSLTPSSAETWASTQVRTQSTSGSASVALSRVSELLRARTADLAALLTLSSRAPKVPPRLWNTMVICSTDVPSDSTFHRTTDVVVAVDAEAAVASAETVVVAVVDLVAGVVALVVAAEVALARTRAMAMKEAIAFV